MTSKDKEFTYFEDKGINPPKSLREVFEPRFADRVVELRRVPASEIKPNPNNWRLHPENQIKALEGVLEDIGFADVVICRETPDGLELVDGHARRDIMGDDPIPVLIVDISEDEAKRMLATLDPISAMAETDGAIFQSLIDSIDINNDAVRAMLDELNAERLIPLPDLEIPGEFPSYDEDIPTDYCCPQCGYEWSGQKK